LLRRPAQPCLIYTITGVFNVPPLPQTSDPGPRLENTGRGLFPDALVRREGTCRINTLRKSTDLPMDPKVAQLAQQLLDSGFDNFSERERRVINHIASRLHVTRDVNRALVEGQTLSDRLADRVAQFGGSWTFIMIFVAIIVAWAALNTTALARYFEAFDPYPYIFLNLILSMVAALQAPIILMSQNRQAMRDRIAAGLDYEINLKAEIEIMALHEKLDRIRVDHLEELIGGLQEQVRIATNSIKATTG